jgi:hypothetical protein
MVAKRVGRIPLKDRRIIKQSNARGLSNTSESGTLSVIAFRLAYFVRRTVQGMRTNKKRQKGKI